MKTFEQKHQELYKDVIKTIREIIDTSNVHSEFSNKKVIKIDRDDFQFNLGIFNYLKEISKYELIDNHGYEYSFDEIDFINLCRILDYYNK